MKKRFFTLLILSISASFCLAQPANYEWLHDQAKAYFQQQEYEKSNQCYEQIITELQGTEYESLIPYIKTSIATNDLYMGHEALECMDYDTSKSHLEKAIDYARPKSKTYYSALSWMGEWYSVQVLDLRIKEQNLPLALQYCKTAETYFAQAQQTEKRLNQQLTRTFILSDLSRYDEATILLDSIIADCNGDISLETIKGRALAELGDIETKQGPLQTAIQHLEEAYQICKNTGFSASQYLAAARLSDLYTYQIPEPGKASMWARLADECDLPIKTATHTNIWQYYNTLIDAQTADYEVYMKALDQIIKTGDNDKGIEMLTALINKRKDVAIYPPADLAEYYSARALGWLNKNKFKKSENDYLEAISLLEKTGESGKPDLVDAWYQLAIPQYYQGKRQETMYSANQSVALSMECFGEYHENTVKAIDQRSNYEGFYAMKDEALQDRTQVFQIIQSNVERNFPYLTATERSAYWDHYLPMTTIMFTFAHRLSDWQSDFSDELFNQQLLAKGLLLTTESALQRAIDSDPELKTAYQNIRQLRLKALDETTSPAEAESATLEADRLERSLGASANSIHQYMDFLHVNVNDVKARLQPNDIAVEFVDYRIGKDSTMYAALILSPRWEHVRFIPLLEKREVTSHSDNLNRFVWKPILEAVGATPENIYFSPTGLLYQLPIESQLWLDEDLRDLPVKMHRMSSTRWLAVGTDPTEGRDAVVYGGLSYDMTISEMQENDKNYPLASNSDNDSERLRWAINEIRPLPKTKEEAEKIVQIINALNDFHADLLTGVQGTEASFKYLDGKRKRIIHIATHGFYQGTDDISTLDALSYSGLYFAGADNVIWGESIPPSLEDGVLTADEVAVLDLRGLDLVVLSACETGQGKITSDGVFGLQRGFKKAGAHTILMSLWKVNDAATQLLMTTFYQNWMEGKHSKHEALEMAKQTVRSHTEKGWDNPKYWAAFILLDALD